MRHSRVRTKRITRRYDVTSIINNNKRQNRKERRMDVVGEGNGE